MNARELVLAQLILEMVGERLGRARAGMGFVLDGVPRTLEQAVARASELRAVGRAFTVVLEFDVSGEDVIRRQAARQMCATAGQVYRVEFDPASHLGCCDGDGSELVQPDDDRPAVVENRLRVYRASTQPLVAYYAERRLVQRIDPAGEPGRVAADIEAALATEVLIGASGD